MNENNFFRTPVWYPALAPYTWKTLFVKLRDEAVTLLASGLEDKNVMYSDVAKQVMHDLSEPMGSIPGNAFAFVDNCAPTDTERFFNKGGAVYSPRSALFYLLCSKKVTTAAANGEVEYICLRPFRNITLAREFRLFVFEGKLSAMSQYHLIRHFRRLEGCKENYWKKAEKFVNKIKWRIPVDTFVMDIYITSDDEILIVDFNSWGGKTDPLMLRTWDRNWSEPVGIQLMAPPTEISGDVKVSF